MNQVQDISVYKERAHKLCQEFLGGAWKTISLEDLRFDVVSGGLSNKLFYCALPENWAESNSNGDVPKDALLRIYGPLHDCDDFRLQEITIFMLLSERKLGPKVYGLFSDGRLEEYIPSRTVTFKELITYSTSLAEELAKIHSMEMPIRKKPLFPNQAYEWLEFAEKNTDQNSTGPFEKIILSGEIRRELEWVESEIVKRDCTIVFCHNDFQGSNILLLDSPKPGGRNMLPIDFEFGAYNYRGFDIANYFNARCYDYGMTEDLSFYCHMRFENYPTECQQMEFINFYLKQLQKEGISLEKDFETERNKILKEISLLRLAVMLHWNVGIFKFSCVSSHDIPYTDFIEDGWKRYQTLKEEYLSNIQSSDERADE